MKLARLNGDAEIFHSIQGEGVSAGVPSVFVRLSLCNLHCRWCDTDYTWNWKGTPWPHDNDQSPDYQKFEKSEQIEEIQVDDLAQRILSFNCTNIVLTGGEPLLQAAELAELVAIIRSHDSKIRFEIETNGTQDPGSELWQEIDQFNISPKLSNSGNPKKLRENAELLAQFAKSEKAWFKFVIKHPDDLEEIQHLEQGHKIPRSHILLMPEGTTAESIAQRREWLAELCCSHGYRFSDRLHVNIWGAKRGV